MENQVLTIDQCKELVALGLDMSDASMCYLEEGYLYSVPLTGNKILTVNKKRYDCINEEYIIPTFTLQDILEMLSIDITQSNCTYHFYLDSKESQLYYRTCDSNDWLGKCLYIVDYSWDRDYHFENNQCDITASNLLEAAFNMLKWCLENKYI